MLERKKTFIFSLLVVGLGALEAYASVIPTGAVGPLVSGIGIGVAVLRLVTRSPVFTSFWGR